MNSQERKDFYAGLAMLGLIINGDYALHEIPNLADKLAKTMSTLREESKND